MILSLTAAVIKEIFLQIVYAPVWWYTSGAKRAGARFLSRLRAGNDYLGWSVWLLNFFTPMYGQSDLAGRLISLGVRAVQTAARTAAFFCWFIIAAAMLAIYFIWPIAVLSEIVYHFSISFV